MKNRMYATTVMIAMMMAAAGSATETLVSHYPFDEDTTDSVGTYNLNHVPGGEREPPSYATVDLADGTVTNAAVFNGLQYLRTDDNNQFADGPATIAFWVKADSLAAQCPVGVQSSDHRLEIRLVADGKVSVMTRTGTDAWTTPIEVAAGYAAGDWVHVALTYDPGPRTMVLYLDGIAAGTSTPDAAVALSGQLVVGRRSLTPTQAFSGQLADLRIYNYEIGWQEIRELADMKPKLVSHYLFDQDTTDSVGTYNLNHVPGGEREPPSYATVDLADGTVTNAAVFNGLQYLRTDDNNQFADGPATIAFWVKADSLDAQCPVGIQSTDHRLEFRLMADGTVSVMTMVLDENSTRIWSTPIEVVGGYSAGDWVHVALTYDPEGAMTLYLDGVEAGSAVPAAAVALSGQLMVGRRALTPIWAFSGQLADLRVYNDLLDAQEIADLRGEVDEPVPPPDIEQTVIAIDGSEVVVSLSFTPVPGKSYALQFTTNLVDGIWTDVVIGATESPLVYANENPAGFMRIKAE